MNSADRARLAKAIEWEKMRADQLNRAMAQQRADLAQLRLKLGLRCSQDQMDVLNQAHTGMASCTTGAMTNAHTGSSVHSDYISNAIRERRAAAGEVSEEEPPKTYKLQKRHLVTEEPKPVIELAPKAHPQLTWETSPLFGRPAFGRFYNWSFHSPFRPLANWFVRWAINTRRSFA